MLGESLRGGGVPGDPPAQTQWDAGRPTVEPAPSLGGLIEWAESVAHALAETAQAFESSLDRLDGEHGGITSEVEPPVGNLTTTAAEPALVYRLQAAVRRAEVANNQLGRLNARLSNTVRGHD